MLYESLSHMTLQKKEWSYKMCLDVKQPRMM